MTVPTGLSGEALPTAGRNGGSDGSAGEVLVGEIVSGDIPLRQTNGGSAFADPESGPPMP